MSSAIFSFYLHDCVRTGRKQRGDSITYPYLYNHCILNEIIINYGIVLLRIVAMTHIQIAMVQSNSSYSSDRLEINFECIFHVITVI